MKKQKSVAATINTALKSGDTTRPIIGRDAYAPKAGRGDKTAKTLTALVKKAREAVEDAENCAEIARKNRDFAFQWREQACEQKVAAIRSALTAKWCAAIAAASAIISILAAAI